jgi:hypothetical protein
VLALRRRWRALGVFVGAAIIVLLPWDLWLALHRTALAGPLRGSYGSYGAWLAIGARNGGAGFVLGTVAANFRETIALFADRCSLSDRESIRTIVGVIAAAGISFGAVRAIRRAPVMVGFAAVYFAILLVWPFTPWRFVFAVWPVVILFAGEALAALRRVSMPRVARIAFGTVAALLLLGAVKQESRAALTHRWFAPANAATAQIAPLVGWVASNTKPSDVVAVDGEQLVYLFTGRRAVPVAPLTAAEYLTPRTVADNARSLRELLGDLPITFVATIAPSLRASAERLVASGTSNASSDARLIPVAPVAAGEAFRVERQ